MELLSEVRGKKKPSPAMSIEIVRFYAFAAPDSSLARHRRQSQLRRPGSIHVPWFALGSDRMIALILDRNPDLFAFSRFRLR